MALQTKKNNKVLLLLSFLLPFLLSTIAFALKGVAPFGPDSVLRSDAWAQYHPYLSLFRHTLLTGGSLEHTWSIGMGTNFLPTIAYYLSSPLYLFSLLVPEAFLSQFMLLLTIVKLSLAGLFFGCFLLYSYRSKDHLIPFFALLYSLCAWSAGYYSNLIWLDVFALLPLLITGTLSMLREGRFRLYTLSLGLCFWCNYYLSFCCCIFVLLSFLGYQICKWKGWQNLLRSFLRFGLCTLLAFALAAVLLIPTLQGMQNTASAKTVDFSLFALSIPDDFYGFSFPVMLEALSQVTARTLTNMPPTNLRGLPNLFCGYSTLILGFSFLWNRSFSRRDRLFHGILLAFFIISCVFKLPDYVWHGFHFPNMLPARFSFLFSFTLLTMAFRSYTRLHRLGAIRAFLSIGCGGAVLLLALLNRDELSFGYYTFALNLLVLAGTAIVILLQCNIKLPKLRPVQRLRLSCLILSILILGEGFLSIYSGAKAGLEEHRIVDYAVSGQQLYETVSAEDPELFYRAEYSHNGTSNDGAIHHYNGVDAFSSTALVNHGNLASALGLRAWPESNSTTYVESAPFTNTLCGIKYLICKEGQFMSPDRTPLVESLKGYELRSLPSYIGMGFMTHSSLSDFSSLASNKNPFEEQSELFRLATGLEGDLYHLFYNPELEASEGCTLEYTENDSQFLYQVPDNLSEGTFTLRYTLEESGLLCMATRMLGGEDVDIYRNGELILNTGVSIRGILSLGQVEAGDVIELVYESGQYKKAGINNYMAIHNDQLLEQGLELLSDEVWNITYVDDTTLSGTITALEDGLFYSSIPYEPGWTVTVDGVEIPVAQGYDPKNPDVKLTDAQICFPLTAGDHEITMTYRTPGLRAGLILSLGALVIFLLFIKKKTLLPDLIPTTKGETQ